MTDANNNGEQRRYLTTGPRRRSNIANPLEEHHRHTDSDQANAAEDNPR